MIERYLEQLNSPNVAQRREAILALGKLRDPRALPHLAQRYKIEPDVELRDLIIKAGKYIQQAAAERQPESQVPTQTPSAVPITPSSPVSGQQTSVRPAQSSIDDLPDPDPELFAPLPGERPSRAVTPLTQQSKRLPERAPKPVSEPQPVKKPVTERQRTRAKEHLQRAYGYQANGDSARATIMLARALRTDPELKYQPGVQGLAMSLVGGDGRNATELVLEAAQQLKVKAPMFDQELIDVVLAAIGLFVMIVVFSVATFYGTSILGLRIASMFFGETFDPVSIQRELAAYTLQTLLPETARNTSVTLLGTVFNLMIVYWVGTWMGGSGSVVRYLKVMLSLYIVFYLLLSISLGLMVFGVFNLSTAEDLIPVGLLSLVGSVLAFIVGQVYLTSRVQEFSFVHAAVSVIAGGLVAGFIINLLSLPL
ncbi:MAG: hypothetical protein RML95_10075 [Anaerolineae bacterium]|nr:hypothetical protein [Anaerolineae bacterium]